MQSFYPPQHYCDELDSLQQPKVSSTRSSNQ